MDTPTDHVSNNGLTVSAIAGDGDVLLAFSLDDNVLKQNELAGFSIQLTPPNGPPAFLSNRLNFTQPVTAETTPQQQQKVWTSSQDAPFQKFHWVHFPQDVGPGEYTYKVTARYCQGSKLVDGPSAEVSLELVPAQPGNFQLGLTRGYVSSQAYATKFQNKDIRPQPKTLDYSTKDYQPQYEWLGWHARKLVFDLLNECVNDKSITVDMFAYDFDEPDILKLCEDLGPRHEPGDVRRPARERGHAGHRSTPGGGPLPARRLRRARRARDGEGVRGLGRRERVEFPALEQRHDERMRERHQERACRQRDEERKPHSVRVRFSYLVPVAFGRQVRERGEHRDR